MKNKFLSLILVTILIFSCFTVTVFAAEKDHALCVPSGIFTLFYGADLSEKNVDFTMTSESLSDVTADYIDKFFDKGDYDAKLHSAFKAQLIVNNQITSFTKDMTVTINLGDAYADKEIFVVCIDSNNYITSKVNATRNGSALEINGADFEDIADGIVLVMTSNKTISTKPASPVVPAIICIAVAIGAIAATIVIVNRKNETENMIG